YGEAAEQFRHLVSIDPANMQGWSNLATSLMMSGNATDAEVAFRRSLEIEPSRDAFSGLGILYYNMGRIDDAVMALERAVGMAPHDHLAWANLGDALSFGDDAGRAQEAFR